MVVDVLIIVLFSQFREDEFNKYYSILKITLDQVCAAAAVVVSFIITAQPVTQSFILSGNDSKQIIFFQ